MPEQARKFRTREVEAMQWTGDNAEALVAWTAGAFQPVDHKDRTEDPEASGELLTGHHRTWWGVSPGEWVIRIGNVYCALTEAAFEHEYEPEVEQQAGAFLGSWLAVSAHNSELAAQVATRDARIAELENALAEKRAQLAEVDREHLRIAELEKAGHRVIETAQIANEPTGTVLLSAQGDVASVDHGASGEWLGGDTRVHFLDFQAGPWEFVEFLPDGQWSVLWQPKVSDRG
ncbi:hypothetical protein ACFXG4_17760 [Nocardia sp. NPDC059246]|uniref:hypothetical protein n=1 Tax=unclassified Nocardia TaxID=2637762 RepID=UPI0036A50345